MSLRYLLSAVSCCALFGGCDPVHQGYVRIQPQASTRDSQSRVIRLPIRYVEGALAVFDEVAAANGFPSDTRSASSDPDERSRRWTKRSYACYPEQGMYAEISLRAGERRGEYFEIEIEEYYTFGETKFGRKLRSEIEARLRERFPEASISSRP